jgi:hypothetical protein
VKKLIVLALIAAMIAIVSVNLVKAEDCNKPDPNAPKDPNISKETISILLTAEPNVVEPNAPAQKDGVITIRGKLVVTKDEKGVITSVKLERKKTGTTHNIVLDAKGNELAKLLAGKTVEVTGKETTKGDEKWLTVEKFAEKQRPVPGDPNKPHRPGGPGQKGGK